MKKYLFLLGVLLYFPSAAQSQLEALEPDQWQEDLEHLSDKMVSTIPDLFQRVPESEFMAFKDRISDDIPNMSTHQVVLAFQKLLALAGDEGTFILLFQEKLDYKVLPIKLYQFEEGIFVCDAVEEYQDLIGARLTHVEDQKVEELEPILKPLISSDNPHYFSIYFPFYILVPQVMQGLGIASQSGSLNLVFEQNEETLPVSIEAG